ncbi:hypothetical protein [Phocaeicola paurosaccharolyticus]|uniref:hypothetical protein n=1 Tax=Phocaeicola paurosaccharolyticus TaxID=732242 RepID=UPI0004680856|nr:hypothetical protein [Phocaeicola paurosaccharolyticus]
MESLINGETIKVDNHNSGQEIEWGKGIHLHKRMNNSKSRAEVLIPIDGSIKDLQFKKTKSNEDIHIKNEIKEAFNDQYLRKKFIIQYYKCIDRFNENKSIDERQKIANRSAETLASFFGLKPHIVNSFKKESNIFFSKFMTIDKKEILIESNYENNSFIIGRNREDVDNFDSL